MDKNILWRRQIGKGLILKIQKAGNVDFLKRKSNFI